MPLCWRSWRRNADWHLCLIFSCFMVILNFVMVSVIFMFLLLYRMLFWRMSLYLVFVTLNVVYAESRPYRNAECLRAECSQSCLMFLCWVSPSRTSLCWMSWRRFWRFKLFSVFVDKICIDVAETCWLNQIRERDRPSKLSRAQCYKTFLAVVYEF